MSALKNMRGLPRDDLAPEVGRLATAGLGSIAIAEAIGIAADTVRRIAQRNAITVPDNRIGNRIGKQTDRFWTPERVAQLRGLVANGTPFSEIGSAVGCTKNMAIAKATRMGFERRPGAPLTPRQEAAIGALTKAPTQPPKMQFPPSGRCVWPNGHPGEEEFHFCGERVATSGAPYCGEHQARAFVRPGIARPATTGGIDDAPAGGMRVP